MKTDRRREKKERVGGREGGIIPEWWCLDAVERWRGVVKKKKKKKGND